MTMKPTAVCPVCGESGVPDGHVLNGHPIQACPSCSHRFAVVDRPPDAVYETLYAEGVYRETITAETLRHVDDESFEHPTYRPFFRFANPRRYPRLLDVACGTGRFCRAAERRGWQVTGIDVSSTAIAVASKLSGGRFLVMSLDEAAERLGTFDVVTSFEFIEHGSDPRSILATMMKLVRPGGLLLVTVPCWDWPGVQAGGHPEGRPPLHLQFFVPRSLKRLMRERGLQDVIVGGIRDTRTGKGLPGVLRRLRGRLLPPPGLFAAGRSPAVKTSGSMA